jgi:hypothetical protein
MYVEHYKSEKKQFESPLLRPYNDASAEATRKAAHFECLKIDQIPNIS